MNGLHEPSDNQGTVTEMIRAGLDFILPPVCCFCRRIYQPVAAHPGICRFCLAQLPLRFGREQRLVWPDTDARATQSGGLVYCAAYYREQVREILIRLKFADAPELSVAVASLMCLPLLQQPVQPAPAAVVAVPLHAKRLHERGFNQAGLLAGLIASRLSLPDLSHALLRVQATRRQSELPGRAERLINLTGAFRLERAVWQRWLLTGKTARNPGEQNILLVDDVLTTGATLLAAAEPLLEAGFRVTGLVAASNSNAFLD